MSGGLPAAALQPHPAAAAAAGSQPVQHVQAGLWWPAADPARLRAAAAAWRSLASEVEAISASASSLARSVASENQGQAIDAFEAYWGSRWAGSTGALPAVTEGARTLADGLDRYAAAVEKARAQIEELIAAAVTVAVIGIGLTVLTVGISDVAAGAVAGSLIAAAAAVGIELSTEVAAIIATALLIPAFGAIESAGIDIALQLGRVYGFHDQAGIDWAEVARWAEVGAVTAPIGAAVGIGVGAAGEVMAPAVGRIATRLGVDAPDLPKWAAPLGQRLAGGTVGSIGGATSAGLNDELATGHVSREDVTAAALAGFVGGAAGAPRGASLGQQWRSDRLPGFRRARIDRRKFVDYAMNSAHPDNEGKWRAFTRLGYDVTTDSGRQSAADDVISQLVRGLGKSRARSTGQTQWGPRYETITTVVGRNGKNATLVAQWQLDGGNPPPKLITLWLEVHT